MRVERGMPRLRILPLMRQVDDVQPLDVHPSGELSDTGLQSSRLGQSPSGLRFNQGNPTVIRTPVLGDRNKKTKEGQMKSVPLLQLALSRFY